MQSLLQAVAWLAAVLSVVSAAPDAQRLVTGCPPNAFWDEASGQCYCKPTDRWTAAGDACCPPNGFFDWSANKCSCKDTDQWTSEACCPPHGHYNWPADKCDCDGGYDWNGSACVPHSGPGPQPGEGISKHVSEDFFNTLFKHRGDSPCPGWFYTYQSFLNAAAAFPSFANGPDDFTNKRELAAFFAQISHETTGGYPGAPDSEYAWGLCFIREGGIGPTPTDSYCDPNNAQYPCAANKAYYGRGPIQLSWNYNYGQAGSDLGVDLLNYPETVEQNAELAFKTAIWFWMTPRDNKPSCHAVMAGEWSPSAADQSANRWPGFGVVTNIINGGLECGQGSSTQQEMNRVGFFQRYVGLFGVDTGSNLYCSNQQHF